MLVGEIWREILFGISWLLAVGLTLDRGWKVRASMQISVFTLLAFGVLPRPNALAAAPVLFAYMMWPSQFSFRRSALFYVPAALSMLASRK